MRLGALRKCSWCSETRHRVNEIGTVPRTGCFLLLVLLVGPGRVFDGSHQRTCLGAIHA